MLIALNAEVPKAMGWVRNGNEQWVNPQAPNVNDREFVLFDDFNPASYALHTQTLLLHMRMRGYDYTLDTFGENPAKPFQALFILKGKPEMFEECGETQEIAICAAAILALRAAEKNNAV